MKKKPKRKRLRTREERRLSPQRAAKQLDKEMWEKLNEKYWDGWCVPK